MPPLLLLLLLLFLALLPLATPLQDCQGHTVCLHIVSCYDDSELKPGDTRLFPKATVISHDLSRAIENKRSSCELFGVISTLAIVSSFSSLNVSFETDLRYAEILIGKPEDPNYLRFHTGNDSRVKINGLESVLEVNKRAPIEAYGRTTYSFQLEHPNKKRFQAFIGERIIFKVYKDDPRAYDLSDQSIEMDKFLKKLKDNLACDVSLVHNGCNDYWHCRNAPLIRGHSVSCEPPNTLQYGGRRGAGWQPIVSVLCRDQQWIVTVNRTMTIPHRDNLFVVCNEPVIATTTTTSTSTTTTTIATTSNATATPSGTPLVVSTITSTPSTANETMTQQPDAIHQTAGNNSSPAAPNPQRVVQSKESGVKETEIILDVDRHCSSFLAIIAIGNVIGCILCRRKQGGESKASVKKVEKRNHREKSPKRNKKKKSAKEKRDDESSSNHPESSESKVEAPEKTIERKPLMQKSLHASISPTVSSDATEMHLDRLKTEVFEV